MQLALLVELMRADFRERSRRQSFLMTLLVALLLGYLYMPSLEAGYITLSVGGTRGIYNSAWVGAIASLLSSSFLSIIGFYIVKNALARDRRTGVGQILAATPLARFQYLLGKALSNFAVLAALQGAVVLAVTAMQLLRGEDTRLDVVDLLFPSLFMVLPFLAVVASTAVLFESIKFLRGALGNVIFYFLWIAILITSFDPDLKSEGGVEAYNDAAGVSYLMSSITDHANKELGIDRSNVNLGVHIEDEEPITATLVWPGMNWTAGLIATRLLWFLIALGLVGLAVPFFDRFGSVDLVKKKEPEPSKDATALVSAAAPVPGTIHLTPLQGAIRPNLLGMVRGELKLMQRSIGRWWFLVAAALGIVLLFVPLIFSRVWLWPIAWIWPIGLWAGHGTHERRFDTEQMLYSVAGAYWRRLFAIWFSGVVLAALCGAGIAVRFLLAGDTGSFVQWLIGAMFIPTFALACGVWTSGTRLFEGLYITLWYIGPINRAEPFDYMGARAESLGEGVTLVYAVITLILAVVATAGRKRQMNL